ncbi:MAG TPA: nitroreductase/quinone reductase family protein [Solirubrobacteraceae bacterium]
MRLSLLFARLVRTTTRSRLQPRVGALHARVLRRTGWRRSRLFAGGQPVLVLTTTGRRTGALRSTVVAYVKEGDAFVVGGLNLGSDRDPAWALNLDAEPQASVTVGGSALAVRARRAEGEEAARLWRAFVAQFGQIAATLAIVRRQPPLYVLEPSSRST